MMIEKHKAYLYMQNVVNGKEEAPRYVIKQIYELKDICDGKNDKYCINLKLLKKIDKLLKMLKMPKGLLVGRPIYEALAGFQYSMILGALCVVHREDEKIRRYETVVLEICRKNGKTFIIALIFVILFLIEPKFSKFYSVAPDGSLSREIKSAIEEIIKFNKEVLPQAGKYKKFKIKRDEIHCFLNDNEYVPLNYSNSRLDGKLPNAFCADEVGALPNQYAVEAMQSGQLTILNKLGFIISTKYPNINNPFEDIIEYSKKILDGVVEDDTVFSLLYEPDEEIRDKWETDDRVLKQANPLALVTPKIWEDLLKKRTRAINMLSARENFLTKHCNIIYQGQKTESFVQVEDVRKCKVDHIEWQDREVYLGVDLSLSNDNCSVSFVTYDEDTDSILAHSMAFIPEGRIEEKTKYEHVNYQLFVDTLKAIACGDLTVDYSVIEDYVFKLEEEYGFTIIGIAYDRYNALSSAQKWSKEYSVVEVRQHSSTLHSPTKLLLEKILQRQFEYEENELLEINFQNAQCTYDTNLNRYINKKKSTGKVDMVVSLINAIYLLEQEVLLGYNDFGAQT